MKRTSIVFKITVLLCCVCAAKVYAQTFEEENTKVMERMDTESFKEKVLLNKAIALDYQLEPFRTREKNKEGTYVMHLDARLLRQLIETAERGNMDGRKKPETMGKIFKRSRKEVTANNVIPVGIINMDAVLLSEAQVEENIKVKREGKKADASKYENIEFIAAGPLQDEVFQGDVQFQLNRELLYGNNKNEIKSVSIDFLDGKGWRKYSLKDELIRHRFQVTQV
ncbi:hypothetical protein CLV98_102503 [Dyadobacter jejuensis]|uniref:Uncharacterized protein n=1 Tax=Dyadobacter jejuensis TaxID=1082580 RepID=A0A316AQU6_9BACT|nr:hypothetical protein [Dyadobacter jejuensis]PWJ59669.1 hypothetical protein CLV98_102503 [Dyadobacter jejuensis]